MIRAPGNISPEANRLKATLALRAALYAKIRTFFQNRDVLEVETPLLAAAPNPAPFLESFAVAGQYLQTSPEFAMKRLLAAGSGDIYQICKAFRKEERGRLHNPEFTILEWYRLNFDHHRLMVEVDELLQHTLGTAPAHKLTYAAVFTQTFKLNPHKATLAQLQACAQAHHLEVAASITDPNTWLELLFSHSIEPNLGPDRPIFIYDFPKGQAMLAKTRVEAGQSVASRFEVYYQGIELANGFHELTDAHEQRARFCEDLRVRAQENYPLVPLDEEFLAIVDQIPACAGVALGIDRLLLLASGAPRLTEVLVQG